MKDPIGLENLPQHLKKLKETGSFDENLVVDMGVITSSNKMSILKKASLTIVFCLFVGINLIAYNIIVPKNIIMTLKENEINSVSELAKKMNGEVVSVKKNSDESYEVIVSVRRTLRSFFERKDIK
jgi:hypothetical protein